MFGMCALIAACVTQEEDARSADTLGQVEQAATYRATWTRWISEEDGQCDTCGAICPEGTVAIGVDCSGDYCDNIRLRCDRFTGLLDNHPSHWEWSQWIGRDRADDFCPDGEWITGIKCEGNWCDNVSVRCHRSTVARGEVGLRWGHSEENPAYIAPGGSFLFGLSCFEDMHCDNKGYHVAQTVPLARDSCEGACGGQSSGRTCWCDDYCMTMGDCCTDYEPVCD